MKKNAICAVCAFCAAFLCVSVNAEQPSTGTAVQVGRSTSTADAPRSANTVISELNYKLEYMTVRYGDLLDDIEGLHREIQQQKGAIAEQSLRQIDGERLKNLEAELSLVRTELAQVRESISMSTPRPAVRDGNDPDEEPVEGAKWYRSKWLPAASLGISVLALIIAL